LDGEVVATYTYDAFGELLGSTGEFVNDYLFAGEQFDGELEQYYLRQRFYDAGVGRFTRRDTYEGRIDKPVTLHKYLYGNANPVNFTDPSGLFAITEQLSTFEVGSILAGIGAVGIVVTNDPPPPVPFPFPGGGSIPDGPGAFPNNDGILDRLLDFGRRRGGFGEGPNEDLAERIPGFGEGTTTDDLVSYVFHNTESYNFRDYDGDNIVRTFRTPDGLIEMSAQINIDGDTLELTNISIFPYPEGVRRRSPGSTAMRSILRQHMDAARDQGFKKLRITGRRVSGASFNPLNMNSGTRIDRTIDL
jgi:RHS repeat-associated protein